MIRLTGLPTPEYLDPATLEVGGAYTIKIVAPPTQKAEADRGKLTVGEIYTARLYEEEKGFTCFEAETNVLCVHTSYTYWTEKPNCIFYQFEILGPRGD